MNSSSDNNAKIKKERFKRVAEQRTNKILKTLHLLGNCGNKANYDYSDAEVNKIFNTIEKELKNTRNKFSDISSKDKKFKL